MQGKREEIAIDNMVPLTKADVFFNVISFLFF